MPHGFTKTRRRPRLGLANLREELSARLLDAIRRRATDLGRDPWEVAHEWWLAETDDLRREVLTSLLEYVPPDAWKPVELPTVFSGREVPDKAEKRVHARAEPRRAPCKFSPREISRNGPQTRLVDAYLPLSVGSSGKRNPVLDESRVNPVINPPWDDRTRGTRLVGVKPTTIVDWDRMKQVSA